MDAPWTIQRLIGVCRHHYQEFLKYFGKGSDDDKQIIATITGVTIDQAKKLIADKIRGRLSSGPSENRRTFQFFDRDGSGAIDLDEFVVLQFAGSEA